MISEKAVWETIDAATESAKGYKDALLKLSSLPPGYSLYFAFHYVNADIRNGGFAQLYKNSTWHLILAATEASRVAGTPGVERIFRQAVLYYEQQGRSRLKTRLTDDFFTGINQPMERSLNEIEDEFFSMKAERHALLPALLANTSLWTHA